MPARPLAVGVDLGGTWLRCKALALDGRAVHRLQIPAPSLMELPSTLKRIFARWKCRPTSLVVASKGVWTPSERRRLQHRLKGLTKNLQVLPDAEAAWRGAFVKSPPSLRGRVRVGGVVTSLRRHQRRTPPSRPSPVKGEGGILVIAGTGSIAYARDLEGTVLRAGGLGPFLGDEGSAFWIGREWARRNSLRIPGISAARVAALTRTVVRKARAKDNAAAQILKDAQDHLAALVDAIGRRGRWRKPIRWSALGSVWKIPGFLHGVERQLARRRPKTYTWVPPERDALTAAAEEARHAAD